MQQQATLRQESYQPGGSSFFDQGPSSSAAGPSSSAVAGPSIPSGASVGASTQRDWKDSDIFRAVADIKRPLQVHEGHGYDESEYFDDDDDQSEEDNDRFFNPALLSHIAVRLRDKVPRGTHVKGSIPYERAFTGKDIVVRSNSPMCPRR